MTNPTSNFGWQMPEPTDLVTNLPADFEVFGQAVDSDFADLLGGTTGQVLSKTSNTDLDFTWTAATAGDITGVTAGTGISGGGTSGTVTVTNSMATEIDAKGDLIAGTGADAFSRLAVGTNTYLLSADSAEATGLKWVAAPSSGGMTLLSTTTLTGAETITISGIDQGYKDLQIQVSNVIMNNSVTFVAIEPNAVNNITNNQYVANSTAGVDVDSRLFLNRNGNVADGQVNNAWTVRIENYASTTARKPFSVNGAWFNSNTNTWRAIINGGSISTTSAITSLKFVNQSGDFAAGTVLVYGVK